MAGKAIDTNLQKRIIMLKLLVFRSIGLTGIRRCLDSHQPHQLRVSKGLQVFRMKASEWLMFGVITRIPGERPNQGMQPTRKQPRATDARPFSRTLRVREN